MARLKGKHGFFFTVDALLAASILLGGLIVLSSHYINNQPTSPLNYLAQDIINALDSLQINELNNSYVDELIANGNITDLNNSILQQAGEFWAVDKFDIAEKFMGNATKDIIPERYGFGLWISNDLLYQRDSPSPRSRSSAKKIVSGVDKNKPIEGYASKARANQYLKNSSKVFQFYAAGAGWQGSEADPSEVIIDKYLDLPNVNVIDALFYLSVHIQSGGPDYEIANINDGTCIIMKDDLNFIGGDGTFDVKDVTGCFTDGINKVTMKLRNLGYNAHIHPGTLLKIDYWINGSSVFYENEFSNRYYFDNVLSLEGSNQRSGAWQIVPFYLPEGAADVSVSARIIGRNIYDYTGPLRFQSWDGWLKRADYDYMFFINGDEPFDADDHPDRNVTYTYTPAQVEDELIDGTNVVSVYFNNYGDTAWGDGMPEIYSDPINDSGGSSYVEVNYTLPQGVAPFGSIEVSTVEDFGGEADWEKETSFSFPFGAGTMGDVFAHIVQQYSYMVNVEADIYTPPGNNVFSSPSSRAVPTSVYILKSVLDLSPTANNYVRIEDIYGNDILPNSSVEYSFYVPASVSYGEVFATQQEAEDDALIRLNETLGEFISAQDIIVETGNIRDVPSLWGPSVMEVRVWH
ncbi:hypothetical protein KY332_03035 [Candidatus Woesearchaeota archaeon]|nr:hypothetical protein [Candidatus Woesearchaeota archaeon]